jgi:hypothetical protein
LWRLACSHRAFFSPPPTHTMSGKQGTNETHAPTTSSIVSLRRPLGVACAPGPSLLRPFLSLFLAGADARDSGRGTRCTGSRCTRMMRSDKRYCAVFPSLGCPPPPVPSRPVPSRLRARGFERGGSNDVDKWMRRRQRYWQRRHERVMDVVGAHPLRL